MQLTDNLGLPQVLAIKLANGNNYVERRYTDYQPVRVLEDITGEVIFYGKVESRIPKYDSTYQQILELTCRDNLNELLKRQIDKDYIGNNKRSSLIQEIVTDYAAFDGNIDTPSDKFNDIRCGRIRQSN